MENKLCIKKSPILFYNLFYMHEILAISKRYNTKKSVILKFGLQSCAPVEGGGFQWGGHILG